MSYKQKDDLDKSSKRQIQVELTVDEIKNIFDDISVDDVALLGLDPKRIQPRNLIISFFPVIPPCFVKNTIVYTEAGYKYIQDVNENDKLFTHTGKFEKINEVHITNYTNHKLIEISTAYHPHKITCTPEHPFYVKHIEISRKDKYNKKVKKYIKTRMGICE